MVRLTIALVLVAAIVGSILDVNASASSSQNAEQSVRRDLEEVSTSTEQLNTAICKSIEHQANTPLMYNTCRCRK